MSKNNENSNNLIIKYSSGQSLNPIQLHTANNNQNSNQNDIKDIDIKSINYINSSNNISSKNTNVENESQKDLQNEDKKGILNHKASNQFLKSTKRESSNSYIPKKVNRSHSSSKPEIDINCKKIYNFIFKTPKIYNNYTPKKRASTNYRIKMGNISVKKNSKLRTQKLKNSPCNEERKHINGNNMMDKKSKSKTNNDFAQYINSDIFNFKGNILNITQNYNKEKNILAQSRSFTKVDKINLSLSHNKINNNNFNYINYNIYKNNYKKKKELMVLSKNNSINRKENENKKIYNINSFVVNNIPTSPNSKNLVKSYFMNITKNNYIKILYDRR